ncbi:MAG: hypothetical protein ACXVQW_10990 [Actinomycetota bacterium]
MDDVADLEHVNPRADMSVIQPRPDKGSLNLALEMTVNVRQCPATAATAAAMPTIVETMIATVFRDTTRG